MPPLPVINAKEFIRVLKKLGFLEVRQTGSHCILRHSDGRRCIVAIHGKKEIPRGTLKSSLEDADISVEQLAQLLEE